MLSVHDTEKEELELQLYDWNRITKHTLIGIVKIPLRDLSFVMAKPFAIDPKLDNNKGILHVEVTPIDFGEADSKHERVENPDMVDSRPITNQRGTLKLNVISASNVAAMDVTGTSGKFDFTS
jgi:hypothetical protein